MPVSAFGSEAKLFSNGFRASKGGDTTHTSQVEAVGLRIGSAQLPHPFEASEIAGKLQGEVHAGLTT